MGPRNELDGLYRAHHQRVWAIVYRMTGSAADADDLVQDAFVKAAERAPEGDVTPWLTRVAVNGGIDLLRQRRRRGYIGPWLPEPIDTGDQCTHDERAQSAERDAAHRYDMLESASFAFLVALEALTPRARAVLLLCDVFDFSVKDTAAHLGMTETHVKVTHHRARRVMQAYDAARTIPTRALQDRTRAALATLMSALVTGDVEGAAAMLAEDVVTTNDAGGQYNAARLPVRGRAKVALFWTKLGRREGARAELRMLNGLPALVVTIDDPPKGTAPRLTVQLSVGADGLVSWMHAVLAPPKLTRLS
jgi:RNA polymerase sigma factor (sigma-70 family)